LAPLTRFWKYRIYYPVYWKFRSACWWLRDWFHPYNILRIRNCPHTYTDKDVLYFHACFTLLCRYVEREYGNWNEYVDWCWDELKKFKENSDHPTWCSVPTQFEVGLIFDYLYHWYISVNWKEPCGQFPFGAGEQDTMSFFKKENMFDQLCQYHLELLTSVREYMWT